MNKITIKPLLVLLILLSNYAIAQWQETKFGIKDEITNIATNGTSVYVSLKTGLIYKSIDNCDTWDKCISIMHEGAASHIYSLTSNRTDVFAGTDFGIYLSRDAGKTWREALSINCTVLSLLINGQDVFAGTNQGIYYSSNNGISWKQIDNNLKYSRINSLAYSNSKLYAAVGGGNIYSYGGVCVSNNNGLTWTQKMIAGENLTSIAVNNNFVFAGTELGNVFLSNDNAETWSNINAGVIYSNVKSVLFKNGNIFSANSKGGLYLSTDNGLTWAMESDALIFEKITSLAITDQYIIVGTLNRGVWRRSINDIIKSLTDISPMDYSNLPNQFSLLQNYPNPFNPTTTISYDLPMNAIVRLSIYNLLGQELATLVNREELAGKHEVLFDAKNLTSGIYLYTIQTGSYSQTKQMVLIK